MLWVDEKKGDYVVVWRFDACPYLRFCKRGDVHYREISTRFGVPSGGLESVVLKGYGLYVQTEQGYIRHLDLSGQHSFEDVWAINWHPVNTDVYGRMGGYMIISFSDNFAVTTSGEVLSVLTITYESSFERNRTVHLYKKQDTKLIKVDSLGDEALFLDLSLCLVTIPLVLSQTPFISPVMTVSVTREFHVLTCVSTILQQRPSNASLVSLT